MKFTLKKTRYCFIPIFFTEYTQTAVKLLYTTALVYVVCCWIVHKKKGNCIPAIMAVLFAPKILRNIDLDLELIFFQ